MAVNRQSTTPIARAIAVTALFTAALLLVGASAAFAADTIPPSKPRIADTYVKTGTHVHVSWLASTDAVGPVTYDIYRHWAPVTITNLGSLTPVMTGISELATDVPVAIGEAATSFTLYYAIVARDGALNTSLPSTSGLPDPHGGTDSATCQKCHGVHGVGPDTTAEDFCYLCHGETSSAAGYGAKSSIDIETEFMDYSDQTPGSQHRTAEQVANGLTCMGCHSPHRKPYAVDASGAYDPTKSYGPVLKVQTGASSYTYYSLQSNKLGNAFCFACHGTTDANIVRLDSSAYGATGGDHNASGFATAAHGGNVILPGASRADITCEACHNRHSSATVKLLDHRSSFTSDANEYAQANLCFACHDSGSGETDVAGGYDAPFAWNGRDVSDEFARTSAHPTSAGGSTPSLTCASCHDVHRVSEGTGAWDAGRVSDPDDITLGVSSTTYGSEFADFCLTCHDGTPPSATISDGEIVPYDVAFSSISTVDSPYFTGWDKLATGASFADAGHAAVTEANGRALCENCHDPHGSDFARLTAWTMPAGSGLDAGTRENTTASLSREENLCYRCHGNGTTGDRASGAKDVATKAGLTYAHDPADDTDVHADTEDAADLATRHAECTDCHDPHVATRVSGSATQDAQASTAGPAVWGIYGAAPTYPASNWGAPTGFSATRLNGESTDMEAYLCFKCHSANTTYPSGQTNVALEFNPSNFSSHNVLGQTTSGQTAFTVIPEGQSTPISVTWQLPTVDVFVSGWNWNSKMTCTDCHTNEQTSATQAKGPHGSSAEWIIDPNYPRDWTTVGLSSSSANGMAYRNGGSTVAATDVICAKCHDLYGTSSNEGNWSNTAHNRNAHWVSHSQPKYCVNCHGSLPHGFQRPRGIGFYDDPAPYGSVDNGTTSYALDSVEVSDRLLGSNGAITWSCASCKTHAGRHTGSLTNPWP